MDFAVHVLMISISVTTTNQYFISALRRLQFQSILNWRLAAFLDWDQQTHSVMEIFMNIHDLQIIDILY